MFDYIASLFTLNFILLHTPNWMVWAIIVSGVVLLAVESFMDLLIPVKYKILIKIMAVALFAFGFYADGKQSVLIPQQSVIEKIVVQEKIVTQTIVKYLKQEQQTTEVNHEAIINSINTKDDHLCIIPNSFVGVFNSAAEDTVPDTSTGTDGSPSGIALSEVERTTADNFNTYHQVAEELSALQDWVNKQKEINP